MTNWLAFVSDSKCPRTNTAPQSSRFSDVIHYDKRSFVAELDESKPLDRILEQAGKGNDTNKTMLNQDVSF